MDLHDETGTEGRFRAYAADLASVLAMLTGSDHSRTIASGCCPPRVAQASNHLRR